VFGRSCFSRPSSPEMEMENGCQRGKTRIQPSQEQIAVDDSHPERLCCQDAYKASLTILIGSVVVVVESV
jgi:hypothetical protein